ncbi:hypothetical protein [Streptomyces sp. NPDC002343]
MGSLLNGIVLLVKYGSRLFEGKIDVVESLVIVRDRLQFRLSNPGDLLLLEVAVLLSCPLLQRRELSFQALDAAGRMVGDLLGGIPLPFGTSQLLAQISLLPFRTGQACFQRCMSLRVVRRQLLQGVHPAFQLNRFCLRLAEHGEQERGDLQCLSPATFAGLVGLADNLQFLIHLDGAVLGGEQLVGKGQFMRISRERSRAVPSAFP